MDGVEAATAEAMEAEVASTAREVAVVAVAGAVSALAVVEVVSAAGDAVGEADFLLEVHLAQAGMSSSSLDDLADSQRKVLGLTKISKFKSKKL